MSHRPILSIARPLAAAATGWMGSARWWTEITRVTGGPDTYAMVAQVKIFMIILCLLVLLR